MAKGRELTYFLGANTPGGFYSLYDEFVHAEAGDFLWVLKGGPGCGKSSFMKRIARAAADAGLDVECIRCSGDPYSLDGVYIPALRTAYADGTAPHVLEPPYPGAGGAYLDLSRFYDTAAMAARLEDIAELNRRYKEKYREAYDVLAAVQSTDVQRIGGLLLPEDVAAVCRRAESAARRALPMRRGGEGGQTRRFLSANTCAGPVFCGGTVEALCGRVYLLDSGLGLAAGYLRTLAGSAARRGWDTVCCPDPLAPERLEAVLLPEAGIGYVAAPRQAEWKTALTRRIRLDAVPDVERLRALRPQLRANRKRREQLLSQAEAALQAAKALHDELEALCNPCVDFGGVYAEADAHIRRLLD